MFRGSGGPFTVASAVTLAFLCGVAGTACWAQSPEESPPPPPAIYALAPDSASAPDPVPPASGSPSDFPEDRSAPNGAGSAGGSAEPAPALATEAASAGNSPSPPAVPNLAPAGKNSRTASAKFRKPQAHDVAPKMAPGPLPPTDEGVRARAEVERTEPLLRSVKAKVVRSFNKRAREEFAAATARQRQARESLTQNLYARAERLTLEARSLAREIAVHLGPPQDDADYVAMTLDRTDDALKRANEVLRDAGGEPERRRLNRLEQRQKEAWAFHKEGKTRKSYASTREVRDGVLTLLRDCDDLPVPEATAEKALKHASRSLDQAKGELGERLTASATRLAREARAQMAKAKAAFARKNYRDTLLHSKLVERNLELAVNAQRSATNHNG